MPNKIRWGLLSTANINDALIDPIRQAARSELVAVASRDASKARAYADDKGIPKAHGSYEALLADADVDVVYISLPNALHCEWTVKAAQAASMSSSRSPPRHARRTRPHERRSLHRRRHRLRGLHVSASPQTRTAVDMVRSGLARIQTVSSWFHSTCRLRQQQHPSQRRPHRGSLWDVGVYPNSLAITLIDDGASAEVWAQQIIGETGVDVAMRA